MLTLLCWIVDLISPISLIVTFLNCLLFLSYPPPIQMTQTCSTIHALNFIITSYCLVLDTTIYYQQCSILHHHEIAVRQTVVRHLQARIPPNLYLEFKQVSTMDSAKVNYLYLRLSQESDQLMDRANALGLLVNGRVIFNERMGR